MQSHDSILYHLGVAPAVETTQQVIEIEKTMKVVRTLREVTEIIERPYVATFLSR